MMRHDRKVRLVGVAGILGGALLGASGCFVWTRTTTHTFPVQLSTAAIDSIRQQVLAMMHNSARSWNRGDLDAFVSDYDSVQPPTFVGSKGVLRGRAAIKTAYAPRFAPGAQHDSLSFENVEVDILAPDAAHVLAYYRLTRGDSTTARGPTSLILRKRGTTWKIVHDHSS